MCIFTVSVKLFQWFFTRAYRLCVKTETVITYPSLYSHISIVVEGNLKLYQLFTPCKPYLPNSSDEFRPVCRGGGGGGGAFKGVRTNPPFWLSSGLQNMQAHNKKCILIKTSVRHMLCSTMGNEVCFFISRLHIHSEKVTVDKLPF